MPNIESVLTKNYFGNVVVKGMEDYEDREFRKEINAKLAEAEIEAAATTKRYTRDEAIKLLKVKLDARKV